VIGRIQGIIGISAVRQFIITRRSTGHALPVACEGDVLWAVAEIKTGIRKVINMIPRVAVVTKSGGPDKIIGPHGCRLTEVSFLIKFIELIGKVS
jgi:hypothetical protein